MSLAYPAVLCQQIQYLSCVQLCTLHYTRYLPPPTTFHTANSILGHHLLRDYISYWVMGGAITFLPSYQKPRLCWGFVAPMPVTLYWMIVFLTSASPQMASWRRRGGGSISSTWNLPHPMGGWVVLADNLCSVVISSTPFLLQLYNLACPWRAGLISLDAWNRGTLTPAAYLPSWHCRVGVGRP